MKRFYIALFDDGLTLKTLKLTFICFALHLFTCTCKNSNLFQNFKQRFDFPINSFRNRALHSPFRNAFSFGYIQRRRFGWGGGGGRGQSPPPPPPPPSRKYWGGKHIVLPPPKKKKNNNNNNVILRSAHRKLKIFLLLPPPIQKMDRSPCIHPLKTHEVTCIS